MAQDNVGPLGVALKEFVMPRDQVLHSQVNRLGTDDMLHTVLRRRANGESVEDIQPDLITPAGKRKGGNPSLASIYRALAEHAKQEAYPEAIDQAHTDFATGTSLAVARQAVGQ
jgi:hypothetical protein